MTREKILIVEDNKALSKLIVKKMEAHLDFDVDVAHTFKDALEFAEKNKNYFLALLDLNLPDAPNGEVVDMILEHKIPSIVLTGSMEPEIRAKIIQKNIIDYVYKGNIDDVNYIFTLIERLSKNRNIKILIVDDSLTTRSQVKLLLQHQMFQVFVAAHGEEALAQLRNNPEIKLMLVDFLMPVMDGLELTKEVRKQYSKNDLSIIAMTGIDADLTSARFLKIGANDFIKKPFSREEIACRINNSLDSLEYIQRIQNLAQMDYLSRLPNRAYFFETMQAYIKEDNGSSLPFALALIDVDKFKQINDAYGHREGDNVIVVVANILKKQLQNHRHIVARLGGDEFCAVLFDIEPKKALELFIKLTQVAATTVIQSKEKDKPKFNLSISIGVTFYDKEQERLEDIIHQADKALYIAKKNGRGRVELL